MSTTSFFYIKPGRISKLEFFLEFSKRKCFRSFLILFNDWYFSLSHLPQMESPRNTWWSVHNMKIRISNCSLRVEKSYCQHCFNQVYTFLFNKTNRSNNSPNLFCRETLHILGSSSAHHQEFSTVHSALVYVMQVWWHIPVPNVQWKTPDDGQRNCPKHVEFLEKINLEN